jgi:hypothetical protein
MTSSSRDLLDDEAAEWAVERLGWEAESSVAERRAAACRRLARDVGLPAPGEWRQLRLAVGAGTEADRDAALRAVARQRCQALHAEIDRFAAQFFELSLADRRRQWQALHLRAAGAEAPRRRLEILEHGLPLALAELAALPSRQRELAEEACAQLVLRPAEQADRRRALLKRISGELRLWEKAARRLVADRPWLARLAPDLVVHELAQGSARRKLKAAERRRGAPVPTIVTSPRMPRWGWVAIFFVAASAVAVVTQSFPSRSSQSSRPSWSGIAERVLRRQREGRPLFPPADPAAGTQRELPAATVDALRPLVEEADARIRQPEVGSWLEQAGYRIVFVESEPQLLPATNIEVQAALEDTQQIVYRFPLADGRECLLVVNRANALLLAVWGVAHEPLPSAVTDPHAEDPDAPPSSAP